VSVAPKKSLGQHFLVDENILGVIGRLAESKWIATKTGEEHRALYLNADRLYLSLARLAEARFKPRREATDGRASA